MNGTTISNDGRTFVEYPHLDGGPGVRGARQGRNAAPRTRARAWNQGHEGRDPKVAPVRTNVLRMGPDGNTYPFDSVTRPDSFADDVRFHGSNAYITDAGGPGLIILDMKTSLRRSSPSLLRLDNKTIRQTTGGFKM